VELTPGGGPQVLAEISHSDWLKTTIFRQRTERSKVESANIGNTSWPMKCTIQCIQPRLEFITTAL
jgi:hypothetical protein